VWVNLLEETVERRGGFGGVLIEREEVERRGQ
jgi:hypothetical protein